MSNFEKDKIIWESKIRKLNKQYELFTGIKKLPTYRVCFIDDLRGVNYSMQVLNSKSPMVLNVNMGFMLDKKYNYISSAYHEFTHLCDHSFLLQNRDKKYRQKALSLYSEFHASYIQSLYLLGVSDINNSKHNDLNFDKVIAHIHRSINIINENIALYRELHKANDYVGVLNGYMYYYGAIVAFNQFAEVPIKILSFDFKYNKQMEEFYSVLRYNQVNEDILELSYKYKTFLDLATSNDIVLHES